MSFRLCAAKIERNPTAIFIDKAAVGLRFMSAIAVINLTQPTSIL